MSQLDSELEVGEDRNIKVEDANEQAENYLNPERGTVMDMITGYGFTPKGSGGRNTDGSFLKTNSKQLEAIPDEWYTQAV